MGTVPLVKILTVSKNNINFLSMEKKERNNLQMLANQLIRGKQIY